MTDLETQPQRQPPVIRENAPGATASMVLGIIGVVVAGMVLGIIAIVLAAKARRFIAADPQRYGGKEMATAGMVLGIVGLCIWGIWFIILMVTALAAAGAH